MGKQTLKQLAGMHIDTIFLMVNLTTAVNIKDAINPGFYLKEFILYISMKHCNHENQGTMVAITFLSTLCHLTPLFLVKVPPFLQKIPPPFHLDQGQSCDQSQINKNLSLIVTLRYRGKEALFPMRLLKRENINPGL